MSGRRKIRLLWCHEIPLGKVCRGKVGCREQAATGLNSLKHLAAKQENGSRKNLVWAVLFTARPFHREECRPASTPETLSAAGRSLRPPWRRPPEIRFASSETTQTKSAVCPCIRAWRLLHTGHVLVEFRCTPQRPKRRAARTI